MQTYKIPSPWVQLWDLFLIQFSNWRWSWRSMVIVGTLLPLLSVIALGIFARDSGPRALGYVLVGNVVMSLMFENQNKVASNISFMRARGGLQYFATLPIHRSLFVLATLLSFLVLSLPAMGVTILAGSAILGVHLAPSLLLLLVVPLAAIPQAGIGAIIGSRVRAPEEAGSISLLVVMLMAGLGPVVIPPERLPGWLVGLGYLSPATYAASALRQALLGPVTSRIALDLGVLAALAAGVSWLVARWMDWREA